MWRRYRVRPSTAVGMLMAVGLLFMILLGVALMAAVTGALLLGETANVRWVIDTSVRTS